MRIASSLAFLASLSCGLPANAGSITVGSPPDAAGNTYPFGSTNFLGVYQQVYSSVAFPEATSIVGITFFRTQILATGAYTGLTYTLNLSTSSKPVNGLDLAAWMANVGPDSAQFAQETLSGPAPVGALTFAGGPFTYDPSQGDLLLTMLLTGTPTYTGDDLYFDARNGTSAGQFSRAMFLSNGGQICCGNDNYGLTTTFTTVPEPCGFVPNFGLVGILLLMIRRSAARSF